MRSIILLFAVLAMAGTAAGEVRTFELFGCSIDIPERWEVKNATAELISLYDPSDERLEIHFGKYVLDERYQIKDETEARYAIAGLYEEMGLDPMDPSEIPLTIKPDRAIFRVEFVEENVEYNDLVRKYIEGLIIRSGEEGQVMYLLNASAPLSRYDSIQEEAIAIFSSFELIEPPAEQLFVQESRLGMLMLFIVIVLMVFFFVRNRRVQKSRHPLGRSTEHFWRCRSCGLVNRTDHPTCNRCGAENRAAHTP